jgi:hypothetical protein
MRPLAAALRLGAVALALLSLPGTAPAQASPGGRSGRSPGVVTAIITGTAKTQEAVDRGDAQIQALFRENMAAERRAVRALAAAKTSSEEARRLAADLVKSRRALDSALDQLASKDAEFKAYLESFRSGLNALLADDNPQINSALERYAQGDAAALDDLQEITRLIRKAREAGLRARSAADQRAVAQVYISAWDNGEKSSAQVRAAWEEAAAIEAENVRQWVEIAAWYSVEGKLDEALRAIESGTRVAEDDLDRALMHFQESDVYRRFALYSKARSACERGRALFGGTKAAAPEQAKKKANLTPAANCLGTFARIYRLPREERPSLEAFDQAKSAYQAAPGEYQQIRRYVSALEKKVSVSSQPYEQARRDREEIVALRRKLASLRPKLKNLRYALAYSVEELAKLHYANGASERAAEQFRMTRSMLRELLDDDPANIDFLIDHARPLTWLTSVALQSGDLDTAAKHAAAFLEEVKGLGPKIGASPRGQSLLAWAHHNLGKVADQAGDLDKAPAEFEKSAALRRTIHLADPDNAEAAGDMQDSLDRLARALIRAGETARLLPVLTELLALSEKLSAKYPNDRNLAQRAAFAAALFTELPADQLPAVERLKYLDRAEKAILRIGPESSLTPGERQILDFARTRRAESEPEPPPE